MVGTLSKKIVEKKKYLPDNTPKEANDFDRRVGAYMTVLFKYGIATYPTEKAALFFDYCERIGLEVKHNSSKKLMWVEGVEESIIKSINK